MATPKFDSRGRDATTFAPFELIRGVPQCGRDDGAPGLVLQFHNWDWLFATYGGDLVDGAIGGYYLNGPGVEGLVMAILIDNGLDPDSPEMFFNSEGDACCIEFGNHLDTSIRIAELAADMMKDRQKVMKAVAVAQAQGFGD